MRVRVRVRVREGEGERETHTQREIQREGEGESESERERERESIQCLRAPAWLPAATQPSPAVVYTSTVQPAQRSPEKSQFQTEKSQF